MGLFSRRIHKAVGGHAQVSVADHKGVRSLYLGSDTVQSAMRLSDPDALELEYARLMMAFLLFLPQPRHAVMVGLGGGSLAKFIYRHFPTTQVTALEINPEVVAAARNFFEFPDDDARLRVLIGDGADFVARHPESCDLLMVDGFDGVAHASSLVTQDFYESCAAALTDQGVMVVNLWRSARDFRRHLERIEGAFAGPTLCLPARKRGNVAVLAFRGSPGSVSWKNLHERARRLQGLCGLDFPDFVEGLRAMNRHTESQLLL
jgi:spermidine synthase